MAVAGVEYALGGDVIVAVDGTRVTEIGELRDVLARHKPGDTIELDIYRGTDERDRDRQARAAALSPR